MRVIPSVVLAASVGAFAPAALAQGTAPLNANIDVQGFRPAPGPYSFLTVAGTRVDGSPAFSTGAWLNYGYRAFTIFDANCPNAENDLGCTAGNARSRPIEHLATLNVQATLTVVNRVMLSLDLPLSLETGDAVNPTDGRPVQVAGLPASQTNFAVSDPRIEARVRLAGRGLQGAGLAVAAFGTAPLGRYAGGANHFLGDDSLTVGGRIIGDFRRNRISFGVNLGGLWRPETLTYLSTRVSSRLQWGAAGGYQFTPRLAGIVEVFGSTDFSSLFQTNLAEADLAGRYVLGDFSLTAGLGAGLVRGVGSPVVRAFLGFAWAPYRVDHDRDGVYDNVDRCPDEPEDRDGWEDDDGCPEEDNDGDGIHDDRDRCPDNAEDRDNFQDTDGCPDPDNDNDGVPDGFDSCPREPEDRDGDRDDDGCPDNDRDRDGVPDDQDRCPTEAEDTDGFQDTDGCPEPDNDGDGIPDNLDQCSDEPETRNGIEDDDGCPEQISDRDHDGIPDESDRCPDQAETVNGVDDTDGCPEAGARTLAEVRGDQVIILQQVNFATNSDRIVGRPSFQVLDAVVSVLTRHPELPMVEVQGHTDNRGNPAANRTLSERRANAVMTYLSGHGIAAARLRARGFGPDAPLESNSTPAGRTRNRRVEFHIVAAAPPGPAQAASPAPAAPSAAP